MMLEAGRRNSWPCSVIYQSLEKLDIAVDVPWLKFKDQLIKEEGLSCTDITKIQAGYDEGGCH